jgi:hypothetical protein
LSLLLLTPAFALQMPLKLTNVLARLTELDLSNTQCTDDVLRCLKSAKQLARLSLARTAVSGIGLESLQSTFSYACCCAFQCD